MVGIGSHDKALPQQRGKVIAIEMDAAANANGLAKDIDPAQKPDRPRLLIIVKEERLMCTTPSYQEFLITRLIRNLGLSGKSV